MSFQYRGLKGQLERHIVTEAELDHRLNMLRNQSPRILIVEDRLSRNGDEVILDYAGFCDGVQFPGGSAEMQSLVLGSGTFIPGFEEQLVDKKAGDEVDVKVTFPTEYHAPQLAGKEATFRCTIHQVREKTAYEADDVFAMEVGGCRTYEEMRKVYWEGFQKYADNQSEMELQEQLLQAAAATLDYTPTEEQIEQELDEQMNNLRNTLAQQGLNMEMYCRFTNSTEEKLRAEARGNAVKSLLGQEAIARIVEAEKLEVEPSEWDSALEVICRQNNMSLEMLKPHMDEEFETAVKRSILMGKVMLLIRQNADITESI